MTTTMKIIEAEGDDGADFVPPHEDPAIQAIIEAAADELAMVLDEAVRNYPKTGLFGS